MKNNYDELQQTASTKLEAPDLETGKQRNVFGIHMLYSFFCCVDGGVDGGGGGGGDPFLRTEISCKSTISERHKAHEYKK